MHLIVEVYYAYNTLSSDLGGEHMEQQNTDKR